MHGLRVGQNMLSRWAREEKASVLRLWIAAQEKARLQAAFMEVVATYKDKLADEQDHACDLGEELEALRAENLRKGLRLCEEQRQQGAHRLHRFFDCWLQNKMGLVMMNWMEKIRAEEQRRAQQMHGLRVGQNMLSRWAQGALSNMLYRLVFNFRIFKQICRGGRMIRRAYSIVEYSAIRCLFGNWVVHSLHAKHLRVATLLQLPAFPHHALISGSVQQSTPSILCHLMQLHQSHRLSQASAAIGCWRQHVMCSIEDVLGGHAQLLWSAIGGEAPCNNLRFQRLQYLQKSSSGKDDDGASSHHQRVHDRRQLLRDLVDFTVDVATGDRTLGLPFSRQKEGIDKAVWLANALIEYLDSRLDSNMLDKPYWLTTLQKQLNLPARKHYPLAQVGTVLCAVALDPISSDWCTDLSSRCSTAVESLCMLVMLYRETWQQTTLTTPHNSVCATATSAAVKRVVAAVSDPAVDLSVDTARSVPIWLLGGPLLVLLKSELESEVATMHV